MQNKQDILNGFTVGFEFEFFSKMPRKDIIKSLGRYMQKKIIIPYEVDGFNKKKVKVHSSFVPTANIWKCEPDYSGGEFMHEIITGPLQYSEARIVLIKMNQWLKENAWTTEKTSLHINLGMDNKKLGTINTVLTMNRLKLCLAFDENFIYKRFPKRRNNVYAKSIKQIYPANKFSFNQNVRVVNDENYLTPETKYYGINFKKQRQDYLEFRYVGGSDYEKKTNKILEIMDYSILSIYDCVLHPELDLGDISRLNNIMLNHKKIVNAFSSFDEFIINFKDIKIMVDLDGRAEIIKMYYNAVLRDKIYTLIARCGMNKGIINYDKDIGKLQVKDAVLHNCDDLSNVELMNCKVDGIFYNCDFFNCTVLDSHIHNSRIMKTCIIKRSKIDKSPIYMTNELTKCYIDNKDTLVSGYLDSCIIRNGDVTELTKMINTTKVDSD